MPDPSSVIENRESVQKTRTLLERLGWDTEAGHGMRMTVRNPVLGVCLDVELSGSEPDELLITSGSPQPGEPVRARISQLVRRALRLQEDELTPLHRPLLETRRLPKGERFQPLDEMSARVIGTGKTLSRQDLVDRVAEDQREFQRMIVVGKSRVFRSSFLRVLHDRLADRCRRHHEQSLPLFFEGIRMDWEHTVMGALIRSESEDRLLRYGPEQIRLLLEGGRVHVIVDDLDRSVAYLTESSAVSRLFDFLQAVGGGGYTLGVHHDLVFQGSTSSSEKTPLGDELTKMRDEYTSVIELVESNGHRSSGIGFSAWYEQYEAEGVMIPETRRAVVQQLAVAMWTRQRNLLERDELDQILSSHLPPHQSMLAVTRRLRQQLTANTSLVQFSDGRFGFSSSEDQDNCLVTALAEGLQAATAAGAEAEASVEKVAAVLQLPRLTSSLARRVEQKCEQIRPLLGCRALLLRRYVEEASENALLLVHAAADRLPPAPDGEVYQLEGANLVDVRLPGVHLRKARLARSVLVGATLDQARLEAADLTECVAINASFNGAHMQRVDARGSDLTAISAQEADLSDADLSECNLFLASLKDANLVRGSLDRADASAVLGSGVKVEGLSTREANLFQAEHLRDALDKAGNTDLKTHHPSPLYIAIAADMARRSTGRRRGAAEGYSSQSQYQCRALHPRIDLQEKPTLAIPDPIRPENPAVSEPS